MSITNELRTSGVYEYAAGNRHFTEKELIAIADRIDAEHEAACAKAYGDGVMSVPIALDESAWVKLPVDADGVPIHVGDVMEWPDGKTFDVIGIGDGTLFYVEDGSECADWTGASTKRHHHAPTVEDVLREFALAVCKDEALTIRKGVVEEYAAKLRLAEGEDA